MCLSDCNDKHHPWSSTDSSGYGTDSSISKSRGVPKANSFGGTSVPYSHNLKIPHKSASMSVGKYMGLKVKVKNVLEILLLQNYVVLKCVL